MRAEVNRSDVICVVYSVEDEDTLDRVTGHWLPLIRSTLGQHHHTPIILVGNKVDLVDYSTMEVSLVSWGALDADGLKSTELFSCVLKIFQKVPYPFNIGEYSFLHFDRWRKLYRSTFLNE